jgi:hypothetical protein
MDGSTPPPSVPWLDLGAAPSRPKNLPSRSLLKALLNAICVASISSAAFAQQPSPRNAISQRFYAALAAAAKSAVPEKTKRVGGPGGGSFIDVLEEGAILVGFEVWQGDYSGHRIIRGIRPIFQTASGRVPGSLHGEEDGAPTKVEAKEGYAVAAIEARGGDRLDGIQVLFWKIRPSGVSLEAEGSYKSDWIGGKGGGKALHPLSSNGNPVIGIFGASGNDVDRVGLVYYERH